MLRRLGIRGKVLAALSVPVLVLFLLAGVVSLGSIQEARTARAVTSLLGTLQQSRELVTALQAERREAMRFVSGADVGAAVETSRTVTADELTGFDASVEELDLAALDPAVADAITGLQTRMAGFEPIRGRVDARALALRPVLTEYSRLVDDVIGFQRDVANAIDDRRLGALLNGQADVMGLVERYREEQTLGFEMLSGDKSPDEVDAVADLYSPTDLEHMRVKSAVEQLGLGRETTVPPLGASFADNDSYQEFRGLIATGEVSNFQSVTPQDYLEKADLEIQAMTPVLQDLRLAAQDRAAVVAAAELRTTIVTIAAALAAVVLSIVTALAIARQIVNPLRRLTEAAGTVRDELPRLVDQVAIPGQGPDLSLTTIPVDSKDEVGQLAAAFNEVNATTIQVAQEQAALRGSIAEMFVNVARRDQVLLNRQLSFIDALERSEEDPKTLADLFRLDHLATRMRRNAESLLVLAGIDTGRRLRDPLPTSDVIRTASSEIEHYERVQLDLPVDPLMVGHTALPAAHMLAEILENATVFSEPGTPVHVSTGIDENDVLVTVLDQGLGMTEEELLDANTKIRTTSAGDVLGSQRLGMFVVGRLATRLGCSVVLSRGPGGTGTLVTVRFPLVLFIDTHTIPLTPPTAPAAVHETFVVPEEAAEVVHEAAYAPVPTTVGDVAPGQLGSAENPATEVDLAALTDGTTGLGLPKRRSRGADTAAPAPSSLRDADDAAAASSIPLAPRAEDLAGVESLEQEVWTPPVVAQAAPLSVRRPAGEAPAGLPTREPSTSTGPLPTRRPGTTTGGLPVRTTTGNLPLRPTTGNLPLRQPGAAVQPPAPATSGAPAPAAPERAAMFTGFRSRRAELAAAAIHVEHQDSPTDVAPAAEGADGAERLAAAAAFFGRKADEPAAPVEEPMVIPSLVPDEDEYGDPVFAPGAPAAAAPVAPAAPVEQPWAAQQPSAPADRPTPYLGRHALPPADEVPAGDWRPTPSRGAHAWTPDEPETDEAWAPAAPAPVDRVPTWEAAPAWAPTPAVEQPAVEAPAFEAPAFEAPTFEAPAFEQPLAQPAPAAWPPAGTSWPPAEQVAPAEPEPFAAAPAPVAEPVAPEPVAQAPAAPEQPMAWPSLDAEQVPAAEESKAKRRRWFGRRKGADLETVPEPRPAAEPTIVTGFAPVLPPIVRQSAWTSEPGTHAAEPEPVVEPQRPVPAPEPVAFTPEPLGAPQPAAPAPQAPVGPSPWQSFRRADEPVGAAPAQPVAGGWQPPVVEIPAAALQPDQGWAPTPAWSPEPLASAPAPVAAAPAPVPSPGLPTRGPVSPQTTFTPDGLGGAFDDEVTNMLAQKADIAQQALAELSQLSSYRPQAVAGGSSLVRRTPGTIPAAPAIERKREGQRTERDANQVRSLLSNFQSGTSRGRQAAVPGDAPQDTRQGFGPGGQQDGPVGGHGEPVTTPDADLTQRSTSW